MSPEEIAERILALAHDEGILDATGIEALARGLRERADLLLAERVTPLEQLCASQQRELEWRTGLQRAAEDKAAWLERDLAPTRAELADAKADRDAASTAHDKLLDHHRDVSRQVAAGLEAVAQSLPARAQAARTKLKSLVAVLRAEAGE